MPRNLSADMLAALSAPILNPAVFASITFKSEVVNVWSGLGTTTWNSTDWSGLGCFLGFTTVEDSSVVEAKGLSIMFSGIDPTVLPECLNDYQLGLPVTIYLALWSTTTPGTLIDSPVIAWQGRTDQPMIDVSGTEATINIACETRLLDMNVATDRRYTMQDQSAYVAEKYGSDTKDYGFSFVAQLQETALFWGQSPNVSQNI